MAEIVRRRSFGAVLPLGRHASIRGSRFIHCASASMAPPHLGWAKCYPRAEVQGRTGPSTRTLQAARTDGCGCPFLKLGSAVRYRLIDIEAYEATHLQTWASE